MYHFLHNRLSRSGGLGNDHETCFMEHTVLLRVVHESTWDGKHGNRMSGRYVSELGSYLGGCSFIVDV
jgi:hypothetical protein